MIFDIEEIKTLEKLYDTLKEQDHERTDNQTL